MKFDVVGLGHSAVDYLGVVPRYPALDEKIEMLEFAKQGGGPVATALVTLSRLGASTAYIGKVGDDDFGKFILEEFKKEGVDTRGVIVEKGASSLFAFCVIEKNTGKRTIFWSTGRRSEINPGKLNKELIVSAKFLHLDGHETEAAIQAAKWAREKNIKIILDPDIISPGIEELISLSDVVIASSSFVQNFTGEESYSEGAEKLFSLGPEIVVVTLGEKGCLCKSKDGIFTKPAFKVKVIDTTGAGDVFHGAFIYGLLKRWDLEKIAEFSNAVAAIKCTKLGGRAGIPNLEEVNKFLSRRNF